MLLTFISVVHTSHIPPIDIASVRAQPALQFVVVRVFHTAAVVVVVVVRRGRGVQPSSLRSRCICSLLLRVRVSVCVLCVSSGKKNLHTIYTHIFYIYILLYYILDVMGLFNYVSVHVVMLY